MSTVKMVKKRNGNIEPLDITKIHDMVNDATYNLSTTLGSELELAVHLNTIDVTESKDIQATLINSCVNKIDYDKPEAEFVSARLFLYDLYHNVGKVLNSVKGNPYGSFRKYMEYGIEENRILPNLMDTYKDDLEELETYLVIERDYQFKYLGIKTAYDRYLLKDTKGECFELPQHMFLAIAMFLAINEKDEFRLSRVKEFYDVISKFEVMLATPTLSNARTNRHQLSSCYIGSSPDNIEGIFDGYKEMGLLSKFGGGIGWDWNQIRALGGTIDNNVKAAGGTVPFLKVNNSIVNAVDQLGVRKGAIAVYLAPWHMDIKDFIDLKKNSGEERRRAHDIFPALWLDDVFMERVTNDENYTLFDPYEVSDLNNMYGEQFKEKYIKYENDETINKEVIKAKDLWKQILTSYFETGSPFLCYKDNANRKNPNKHIGQIRSSNLCTEIFQNTEPNNYLIKIIGTNNETLSLPEDVDVMLSNGRIKKAKKVSSLDTVIAVAYGHIRDLDIYADDEQTFDFLSSSINVFCVEKEKIDGDTAVCNLASVNMSIVQTKEDLERVVPVAIRMLDNVIDLNFYPLAKVKMTNLKTRAIGLGVMGETHCLALNKIHFGSPAHFEFIDRYMEAFSYNVIKASNELAVEKGSYKEFKGSDWSKGIMPHDHTNQFLKDNVIDNQPLLDWDTLRENVKQNGMRNGYLMAIAPTSTISILVGTSQAIEPVYKRKWYEENLSGLIPVLAPDMSSETFAYYVPAHEVDQFRIQDAAAIRQKWIDQGQSTNIFVSIDKASGKYLNDLYTYGWKLGNKSNYYLRSQSPEAKNDVEDRSMECSGCQ